MKASVKKKWVAALRSGKYKQSIGALKTTRGFCCLGILTDLYRKEKGTSWKKNSSYNSYYCTADKEKGTLPLVVQKWSGLTSHNPVIGGACLSGLNDNGSSFEKIATLISKHL